MIGKEQDLHFYTLLFYLNFMKNWFVHQKLGSDHWPDNGMRKKRLITKLNLLSQPD